MLIWGSRSESKDLGQIETKPCPTCEKDRPFHMYVQYRLHHIWYALKWVTQRQYLNLCEVCSRGHTVAAAHVPPELAKIAVPAMHRFSWIAAPVLIAIIASFGLYEDGQKSERTAEYMQQPAAGDFYLVDLSRILTGVDDTYKYGVMKVTAVRGNNLEFSLPRSAYEKATALTRDVNSKAVNNSAYFSTKATLVPVADLPTLRERGAIREIRRD